MTRDSLLAVERRLSAASEGSRELDALIWNAAEPEAFEEKASFRGMKYAGHVHKTKAEKRTTVMRLAELYAPHVSTSIDSALALVSRCLPGWGWSIEQFPKLRAQLAEPVETEFGKAIGIRAQVTDAATPALAICLALCRALLAKEQTP